MGVVRRPCTTPLVSNHHYHMVNTTSVLFLHVIVMSGVYTSYVLPACLHDGYAIFLFSPVKAPCTQDTGGSKTQQALRCLCLLPFSHLLGSNCSSSSLSLPSSRRWRLALLAAPWVPISMTVTLWWVQPPPRSSPLSAVVEAGQPPTCKSVTHAMVAAARLLGTHYDSLYFDYHGSGGLRLEVK